jgi:uncharacterized protein
MPRTDTDASFSIVHESTPSDALLAGFSNFGLSGLTAVDFLVDHLELEESGYLTAEGLPSITPFEGGTPRHHTRFFSREDLDVTVLVGELFVPTSAAAPFSDALLEWLQAKDVSEAAICSGVPLPHGPEAHRTFYVATPDYRERRLEEADPEVPPMGSGYLDGVNGAVMEQSIDSELASCVYVTPVHEQVPDVEAAIRLVDTVSAVYDLDVDTAPLQDFAAEIRRHYEELAERLQAAAEEDVPEDRMYM